MLRSFAAVDVTVAPMTATDCSRQFTLPRGEGKEAAVVFHFPGVGVQFLPLPMQVHATGADYQC